MNCDLIVTWPWSCDYPLWRKWLAEHRVHFAKVLVAFSPIDGPDMRKFLRPQLEALGAEVFDTAPTCGYEDWRDAAMHAALDRSTAEWVWFTEQDFSCTGRLLYVASWAMQDSEAAAVREDVRWHPCCLFVKRTLIDTTSLYFGPEPVDHFYTFSQELDARTTVVELDGLAQPWSHPAGTSRNQELIATGYHHDVRNPHETYAELQAAFVCGVPLDWGYANRLVDYFAWYTVTYPVEAAAFRARRDV